MSAADLVFAEGDRVLAMGRLVRDGKDWWLDSQRVLMLASRNAGGRSDLSTRLVDGEAHVAALRKQDPSALRLWAHVIGTWRRGALTVEAIGAGPGRPDRPGPPADTDLEPRADELARLDRMTSELDEPTWGIERTVTAFTAEGTAYLVVELFRVTDELAQWADAQPDGSVLLDPSVRRLPR